MYEIMVHTIHEQRYLVHMQTIYHLANDLVSRIGEYIFYTLFLSTQQNYAAIDTLTDYVCELANSYVQSYSVAIIIMSFLDTYMRKLLSKVWMKVHS